MSSSTRQNSGSDKMHTLTLRWVDVAKPSVARSYAGGGSLQQPKKTSTLGGAAQFLVGHGSAERDRIGRLVCVDTG